MLVDGLEAAVVDRADPTHLDFPYMRWIADVLDLGWRADTPLRAVHVGAGGCVLPRYLAATRPGSHSEAYESDPAVLRALGTVLDLRAEPGLRVREGDGRELPAHPAGGGSSARPSPRRTRRPGSARTSSTVAQSASRTAGSLSKASESEPGRVAAR